MTSTGHLDGVDDGARDRLLRQGGEALYQRLLEMFLAQTPQALEQASTELQRGDGAAAQAVAHRLRASSRLMGATALGDLAEDFEQALREPRPGQDPRERLDALRAEYRRIEPWFAACRQQGGP